MLNAPAEWVRAQVRYIRGMPPHELAEAVVMRCSGGGEAASGGCGGKARTTMSPRALDALRCERVGGAWRRLHRQA